MNRSALLCISLLSLSFYAHGMEEEPSDSPSTSLFPISPKPENRSIWASLLRWGAKQTGTMTPDLAGLGSPEEKDRTITILKKCDDTLSNGDATLSFDLKKQYIERIAAVSGKALEIIAIFQEYNAKKQKCDTVTVVIREAQELLEIHKDKTLTPTITTALEAQLKKARKIVGTDCQIPRKKSKGSKK